MFRRDLSTAHPRWRSETGDQSEGMSAKAEHEFVIFKGFAQVSGLTVCASSIETREPPQPDIWCMLGNKPYFFELGRILSSEQPRLRLEALRRYPHQVQVDPFRFGVP